MQAIENASPLRVALLSDRWLSPGQWSRRGMSAERLRPVAFERLLADPPAAIVVDPACADARQLADCWQLHELLGVPVIVLAEGATGDEAAALLRRGADEVITGTPDASLLAAQVAAILRRSQRQTLRDASALLQLDGDVEVDMVRRIVRRPAGSQSLSRTEFNLLLALVRAGGRACTHHELVSQVWGADCASATHYLRLYIRYLRDKIEADPRRPRAILNVWGVGYRIALASTRANTAALEPAPATNVVTLREVPVQQESSWSRSSLSPRRHPSTSTMLPPSAIAVSR